MNPGQLCRPIKGQLLQVEKKLRDAMRSSHPFITDTIPTILNAGGKRLRPALLLMSARACNYTGQKGIERATAVELIHTASLIHDDAVDNDWLRRGIPTLNSEWGESASIVVGDYLCSTVFEMLAEQEDFEAVRCIASTIRRMASGDLLQFQSRNDLNVTEERYLSIIADKTASLISCSCKMGAMLGESANGEVDILTRYGTNLGMAFQITDDLLDLTGDQEVIGKPVGNDILEGKVTLPLIHTIRVADRADREWIADTLKSGHLDDNALGRMREVVQRYEGIDYSLAKAHEYREACKQEIGALGSSPDQDLLASFADYVVERTS